MNLFRIAARLSQPLSERYDYGSNEMISQENFPVDIAQEEIHNIVGEQEETGVIRKTPGKGYCVKSEKNPDWSGGCYPSKGEAKERLKDVEMFKHMGSNFWDGAVSGEGDWYHVNIMNKGVLGATLSFRAVSEEEAVQKMNTMCKPRPGEVLEGPLPGKS